MGRTVLVVILIEVLAAMHDQVDAQPRHPFPAHCTCRYNALPSSCNKIAPDSYPSHNHVFQSNDCLPDVPVKYVST